MRLLQKAEVTEMVGVSYPTIWRWMRDGKFPRPVEMGERSMWIMDEVQDWMLSLPRRQYGAEKNGKPLSPLR